MTDERMYDVIIAGAGPAGMTALFIRHVPIWTH